ncbi:MAG: hypothetical protein ACLQVN_12435 [Bryobacteraceae bacterium]
MVATVQIAQPVEALDDQGQSDQQPNDQDAVGLVVADTRSRVANANGAVVTDRLGSVRYTINGASIAYYPYGEERTSTPDGTDKFATNFRVGNRPASRRASTAPRISPAVRGANRLL